MVTMKPMSNVQQLRPYQHWFLILLSQSILLINKKIAIYSITKIIIKSIFIQGLSTVINLRTIWEGHPWFREAFIVSVAYTSSLSLKNWRNLIRIKLGNNRIILKNLCHIGETEYKILYALKIKILSLIPSTKWHLTLTNNKLVIHFQFIKLDK